MRFKHWTLGLLFAAFAQAEDPAVYRSFEIKDAGTGTLKVVVLDFAEPADAPYEMTVSVVCNDLRSKPNIVKPGQEILIKNKNICEFRRHEFDDKSKILTIHYSTSEFKSGQAQCNGHWSQSFDLREICSKWQP